MFGAVRPGKLRCGKGRLPPEAPQSQCQYRIDVSPSSRLREDGGSVGAAIYSTRMFEKFYSDDLQLILQEYLQTLK